MIKFYNLASLQYFHLYQGLLGYCLTPGLFILCDVALLLDTSVTRYSPSFSTYHRLCLKFHQSIYNKKVGMKNIAALANNVKAPCGT